MTDNLCFLNGEFLPLSEARIPVLDRGFIFGDGIYEVAPVYGRKLFRFDEHLARLNRSLGKLRIPQPATRDEWLERCRRLVAARPEEEQVVYIQVTRGVAPRDHVMPTGITPTVFMMSNPLKAATPEQRHKGVACITARDFRWERGDIKSTSLLGNVLARQMSADHGAVETIMFRDDHRLDRPRRCAAGSAEERSRAGRHPGRTAARAVRGLRHRLQPAPHHRSRRARR